MIVVARDGSGDYRSIQAAVDAVPERRDAPIAIWIKKGIYHEKVVVNKSGVRLIGEDRDGTVIVNSGCANDLDAQGRKKGTFLSYTMLISGENVTVENLTVRNDAGDGRDVGQAVAVYAAGDRGVFRGVTMLAHQDTLFLGPINAQVSDDALPRAVRATVNVDNLGDGPLTYGRVYLESCFIRGDVDFIFGSYRCWFEGCTLYMNERGGYYTAANTPESVPYGFVFHRCRLTGECAAGAGLLGRPWRAFARTVFLHCDMDEHVSEQGFIDWDESRHVTERLGEYGTTGARSDQSARHPRQKRMTKKEAEQYTVRRVFETPDGWNPLEETEGVSC